MNEPKLWESWSKIKKSMQETCTKNVCKNNKCSQTKKEETFGILINNNCKCSKCN